MDMEVALLDAQARQRGEHLDGSPRRECSLSIHSEAAARRALEPFYNPDGSKAAKSVLQNWVMQLPFMQQGTLLTAIRGPDGVPKFHKCKPVIRWYRRCVLRSAFDGAEFRNPLAPGGGSFCGPVKDDFDTGPAARIWQVQIQFCADDYMEARDELPHHFQMHFMHAAEIVGYKHPDQAIRDWWATLYVRMAHAMHVWPESVFEMDKRLGDDIEQWLDRADVSETRGCAVTCSD